METSPGRVRVLYIGGDGRSGSTVLSGMLGNIPGFVPVGEIRGIWHAVGTNEFCGCGVQFLECAFWKEVGARAFGGWENVDSNEMLSFDRLLARHRSLVRTAAPQWTADTRASFREYSRRMLAIYRAVKDISGAHVIVDSTKDPPYAFLLSRSEGVELCVVHLIRDSRAVAYSWAKSQVERPEYANHTTLRGTFMPRRSPVSCAAGWAMRNSLFAVLSRRGIRRLVVRYEDLMTQPAEELGRAVTFAGGELPSKRSDEFREYDSCPFHTLGGNRVRFKRGKILVRPDHEWQRRMVRGDRLRVTAVTLPWLIAYGYAIGLREAWAMNRTN